MLTSVSFTDPKTGREHLLHEQAVSGHREWRCNTVPIKVAMSFQVADGRAQEVCLRAVQNAVRDWLGEAPPEGSIAIEIDKEDLDRAAPKPA